MTKKKKPLDKLLEEVDTALYQLGVKKASLDYLTKENATVKKIKEKEREFQKALKEYDAAESIFKESLEEEYAKIKKKIDEQKKTTKTLSQLEKERIALHKSFRKKENEKEHKLQEYLPANPKIKILNEDLLTLLKDIYSVNYLYSKIEKQENGTKKKQTVEVTECDFDDIEKYITKRSLCQAAGEKLIKGRWTMNKPTLFKILKNTFDTAIEFCEFLKKFYTSKKQVQASVKKAVTFKVQKREKSPAKKEKKKKQVKAPSVSPEVQIQDMSTQSEYTDEFPPLHPDTIFERFKEKSPAKKKTTLKEIVRRVMKNKKKTIVDAKKQCRDLNTCLILGEFSHAILAFFTAIKHFNNVVKIKSLETLGNNGKLLFVHSHLSDYTAYSMVKIPKYKQEIADNVVYEFLMGLVVNLFTQTPNTVKTLNLYKHKSKDRLRNTLSQQNITSEILKENVELIAYVNYESNDGLIQFHRNEENITSETDLIEHSCMKHDHFILEMLYIPHSFMLEQTTDAKKFSNFRNFWKYEIGFVMFQLYAFLKVYHKIFVHNDLNRANILLCQIPDHHFEYIYKEGSETIKFTSPYLVKTIDYSRSYISGESDRIFDMVCKKKNCYPNCGEKHGYEYAYLSKLDRIRLYLDLIPLYFVEKYKDRVPLDPDFRKIVLSLEYDDHYKNTVQVTSKADIIRTVIDAYKKIKTYIKKQAPVQRTSKLYGTFVIKTDVIPSIKSIFDSSERMEKAFMFHRHVS